MPELHLRSEAGMSLVEMVVTTGLLLVVTVIFLSILTSVQQGVSKESNRSNDNDQARLAVQELDREIRSGNVLYNPANETSPFTPNYSLRVYTQTNANIRNPGNRCVQWRITAHQLQTRNWASTDPSGTVTGWRVVAENIANQDLGVPAFVLDTDPSKGSRIVNVTILTQTSSRAGAPVRIAASISGRNTSYGYPSNVCAVIPAP